MASKRKTATGPVQFAEPKFCADCKWIGPKGKDGYPDYGQHKCLHRIARYISGTDRQSTQEMRDDYDAWSKLMDDRKQFMFRAYTGRGACGPEGTLWEAKPPEPPAFQAHEPIEPGSAVRLEGVTGWKVPRRNWWRWW